MNTECQLVAQWATDCLEWDYQRLGADNGLVHIAAMHVPEDNKRVRKIIYNRQLTPSPNSVSFPTQSCSQLTPVPNHPYSMTMYIEANGLHYGGYFKTLSLLSVCPAIVTPDWTTRRSVWISGGNVTILQEDLYRPLSELRRSVMGARKNKRLKEHVQTSCHLAGKHRAKRSPLAIWSCRCQ